MNINPTDLNYILAVLGERPYREVGALIDDLRRQAEEPDPAATRIAESEGECADLRLELSAARTAIEILNETLLGDALLKEDRVWLDDDLADILDNSPDVAEGLPAWRCHKVVWADKIIRQTVPAKDGTVYVECAVGNFVYHNDVAARFFKNGGDLGYLVIYQDGYVSWSPTEAFEQGYTRIDA